MQHLYAPARTLLASVFCSGVLLALLGQEALGRWRTRRQPWWPGTRARQAVAVGVLVVGYGAYRLRAENELLQSLLRHRQVVARQYRWLQAQRPQRVWLTEDNRVDHGIYWYHQGLVSGASLPLVVAAALPGAATPPLAREYVVFNRQHHTAPPPAALQSRAPAYADAYIYVWRLGAADTAMGK
jgi:hypothetical protein